MYKLLICDDEPLERFALRKIIERKYLNITVLKDAVTGSDAISKVRLYMPDMLLIDIKMPEMSGIDAQKQIIRIHPGIKTAIITAYNDFTYAQEAIRHNVFEYLLKPVPPATLYDCIQRMLALPSPDAPPPAGVQKDGLHNVIQEAIAYIESHFLENPRLSAVAAQVHLSEKYFSRYFKEQTGHSFTDYVNICKINRAKSFLLHTNTSVYKIAMDLNFSDSAYFSKVFCKFEHMTPLRYRKTKAL